MTDTLYTTPKEIEIASSEAFPIEFDLTELLEDGDVPSDGTVTITNKQTGEAGMFTVGSVAFVGNFAKQTVDGFTPGLWRVVLTFTAGPGRVRACATDVRCPF